MNVNLPLKAAAERAEQTAFVTELVTDIWKEKQFLDALDNVSQKVDSLSFKEKAMVRNLNHAGKYFRNVPQDLIIEKEKVTTEAFMAWQQAKPKNAYADFSYHLDKIVELNIKIAHHLRYKSNPYDALLDLFEQGLTAEYVQKQFDAVKPYLTELIQKIQRSKPYKQTEALEKFINGAMHYPKPDQEKLARFVLHQMGFDFEMGRMDVSPHPFTTTLGTHDIRITNMYKPHDFRDSLTSTMHEGGHALYEQRVHQTYAGTPLEGGVSLGIHEALSRFYENQIGRNVNFLSFLTPTLKAMYPNQFQGTDAKEIVLLFNLVKPGFIRIEADEVTYTMHIILRFEMENDLINRNISVKEAPRVWNEKMKQYLGITPKTDTEGILQDVHWSYGSFGYFPSYALGNLYASQFLTQMQKDVDVDKELAKGNLQAITSWLTVHIYRYGSLYWPKELVKKVTDKDLNPRYFVDYLTKKYTKIYQLER